MFAFLERPKSVPGRSNILVRQQHELDTTCNEPRLYQRSDPPHHISTLSRETFSSSIMLIEPSSSLAAVLAFTGLTMFQVGIHGTSRAFLVNTGQVKPSNIVKTRHLDETTFLGRVACSHANCLENLPLFLAVVMVNHMVDGAPDISTKAWWYVTARTFQMLIHWYSVTDKAIVMRFYCFLTSILLLLTMAYETIMG